MRSKEHRIRYLQCYLIESHLTSPRLSFLICKLEITIHILQVCCEVNELIYTK